MKKFSTRNNIIAGFLIAFACVGYFVWATYRNMEQTQTESRNVRSALQVLHVLEKVLTDIDDMEDAQNDYLISGSADFLGAFNRSLLAIKHDSITLARMELHDSTRLTEMTALINLVSQNVLNSKEIVSLRNSKEHGTAAAARLETSKNLMRNIRGLVFSLEDKDRILLRESNHAREIIARQKARQFFILAFVFFIILLVNYLVISDDLKQQHTTTAQLNYNASLINNISDPIVTTDENYRINGWNKHAEELYGWTQAEVMGKLPREIFKLKYVNALAEDVMDEFNRIGNWKGELIHYKKNGEPVNVYISTTRLKDEAGNNGGTVALIRDTTEVVKAREEVNFLASLVEQTSDAIISTKRDTTIVTWNKGAERMYGYSRDEVIGKRFPEINRSGLTMQQAKEIEKVLDQKGYWEHEIVHWRKDFTSFHCLISATVIRKENGEVNECVILVRDISARKKLEEQLQLFNKELADQVKVKTAELTAVFERVTDAFIALDNNWNYTYLNKRAAKLHGREPGDLVGKNIWEEFPEVVNEQFYTVLQEAMRTQQSMQVDVHYSKTNTWFKNFIYPSIDGVSIYYQDITEKKKAEELVAKEVELSNSIINSLPGIFYLYDQAGKFLRWNKNFGTVSGYSTEEISRMHPLDFFDDDEKMLLTEKIGSVFEKGMAEVEAHFFTKDKKKIPYYFNGWSITFEGKTCLTGMGIDITERKKAEWGIKQNEERLNRAQQIAKIGSWEFNLLTSEVTWSKELFRVFELEEQPSSSLYQSYRRRLHPADLPKLDRLINLAVERGEGYHFKHRIICNDGAVKHIQGIGEVVKNAEGKVIGLKGTAQDITEREKAEEQLRQSYKEIRQLAGHLQEIREEERTAIAREIHDELGQQLTGLKMDISWLNKKIAATDEEIKNKFASTLGLIDGTVRSVRRIATELRPSILDDLGLIAAMEWQSSEFEKRSGITTRFINKTGNMNIPSNIATALFRIFQESLTNVARHSGAKNISSSLSHDHGTLALTIADDGCGFVIDQIGEKKTLGLLGMKERTKIMGGRYEIKSAPGEGTVVTVTIPLLV